MTQREKKNLLTVILIVVIGIAGYIGFGPLFDRFEGGVTGEFLAAIFGTVFTIMLTMFLLNKQTEIEEEKSRGESVFNERVELYKQVIDQMNNIVEDGDISITEMNKLQFMLVKLQMVAEDATVQKFINVYDAVSNAFSRTKEEEENEESDNSDNNVTKIEPEDKIAILETMLQFSQSCRVELGLASSEKINTELFAKTAESLKKSQKAVEEKKIGRSKAETNFVLQTSLQDIINKSELVDRNHFDKIEIRVNEEGTWMWVQGIDKKGEQWWMGDLGNFPIKDSPDKIEFKYLMRREFARVTDDLESFGLRKLVDDLKNKLASIDKKYSILTPYKKHLKEGLSRDKLRRNIYYETYTIFSVDELTNPKVLEKIANNIIEVGHAFYHFYNDCNKILKTLGTSMAALYRDSRAGLAVKDDENEEEKTS